jgi:hypothetical protein
MDVSKALCAALFSLAFLPFAGAQHVAIDPLTRYQEWNADRFQVWKHFGRYIEPGAIDRLPVFENPDHALREHQLSEIECQNSDRQMMVRSRERKCVVDQQSRGMMMYDLVADPQEHVNLVGKPGTEAMEAELRAALLRRLVEAQYSMSGLDPGG